MSSRRDFLRRTSLALAGGLIVGDAALEMFARLTHVRKSFPGARITLSLDELAEKTRRDVLRGLRDQHGRRWFSDIPDGGYDITKLTHVHIPDYRIVPLDVTG